MNSSWFIQTVQPVASRRTDWAIPAPASGTHWKCKAVLVLN
jgi:hypothetical protein